MINLKAGDIFKLTTGSPGAIDVHSTVEEVDITSPTAPLLNPTSVDPPQITTATTTDIVTTPTANKVKNIRFSSIYNAGAAANIITVKHTDGTNTPTIIKVTLFPGDALHYVEAGWQYKPASSTIQVPGRFLQTTTLVAGTSFTTGALTTTMRVRGVGGGGAGGGCSSVAAAAAAAGGGGAGGYGEKTYAVNPNTAYAYTVGAAGAGSSGAAGGNGGDSTFTVGAATITAKGGTGGLLATASVALTGSLGGVGGVVGTGGDVNASGEAGYPGLCLLVATPVVSSGQGGSGLFGGGGNGLVTVGDGNAGTGNGSGGGGSATGASTARAGGAGTVGLWVVDEYA